MKAHIALASIAATLFVGCSDSSTTKVAGGGFETSDIQVALSDSSGRTIVGARIWLVKTSSDSDSTTGVLDSTTSDAQGRASIRTDGSASASYSLEAWLGDTLVGFVPRVDPRSANQLSFTMRRPRVLTLPCGPYKVVLPGSHFEQYPSPACRDSFFVLLPPGQHSLYTVNLFGPPKPMPLPVQSDTLPPWNPPPRSGGDPVRPGPFPPPYQPPKR